MPILATGYTPGLYAHLHTVTGPIWDEWSLLHDYRYRPTAFPDVGRDGALKLKLPTIIGHLEAGTPCMWADVDALPVLASPDPAAGIPPGIHFAANVLRRDRPRTGHLCTGLLYCTPAALPVLRHAVSLLNTRALLFIEERALAAAILGLAAIPDPEPAPTRSYPVHRLDWAWCRACQSRLKPADRAYLWHASCPPRKRMPHLKLWIAQGRHTHPAGEPLPIAWRRPTVLPA